MKLVQGPHGRVVHPESPVETYCLGVSLPKWPAMLVTGASVTPDQAKEIIRRTDSAFTHGLYGNDREHLKMVASKLRIPHSIHSDLGDGGLQPGEFYKAREEWGFAWGVLDLYYISNHWVSSSYVFGPHGWCHPGGKVFHFKNVGKWPSVDELAQDWLLVAEAFPFLDLSATFFDREYCEEDPVPMVTIRVCHDNVTIHPGETNALPLVEPLPDNEIFNSGSECGLPLSWFDDWANYAPSK